MGALKSLLAQILGLFVDDGAFAAAIVTWLAFVSLLVPRLHLARKWGGVILFGGIAVILIAGTLRKARH
jgi:hypothetical protein